METEQVERFTFLWTRTQTSILAFVASSVTSFPDAEDILQKVAGVAVRKFDQFDSDGDSSAFTGWVINIARYEVLMFLRQHGSDRHRFFAESVEQIADAFVDMAPTFDGRRHALSRCLKKLGAQPREVLDKRYGEGLGTGQVAELMGLSPGNVSVILNRTYKTLRACIESRLSAEAR